MLAEYEGYIYMANIRSYQVTLMTVDQEKRLDGFEAKRDYFKKIVDINDPSLDSIYDIHYYVKYKDSIEKKEIWLVDEKRAVGIKGDIDNNEIVIDVDHDSKDASWVQYDKGAASKKSGLMIVRNI